jgi:hypothetical protein
MHGAPGLVFRIPAVRSRLFTRVAATARTERARLALAGAVARRARGGRAVSARRARGGREAGARRARGGREAAMCSGAAWPAGAT